MPTTANSIASPFHRFIGVLKQSNIYEYEAALSDADDRLEELKKTVRKECNNGVQ
jgi:hypothetical protein